MNVIYELDSKLIKKNQVMNLYNLIYVINHEINVRIKELKTNADQ